MRRSLAVLAAFLTCASGAAAQEPAEPSGRLPPGATIAGVDVGGLGPSRTRAALRTALEAEYGRTIAVRVGGGKMLVKPASAGHRIDYEGMVRRAFELAQTGKPVDVALSRSISKRRLAATVNAVARRFYRAPRNARVRFGIRRIARIAGRWGSRVDTGRLRRALKAELLHPHAHRAVRARRIRIRPRIDGRDLRRIHHTYISVDRGSKIVRLFKRLRRVRSYRVAVGAAGYDTPRGLHRVRSKQRNPAWHVPNRPWAGSLAGRTIPPGDPRNPLKAAFIAIGGGIGFHGTADLGSIGRSASHGCIRMRVPDVLHLYRRTPIGTPVLVR